MTDNEGREKILVVGQGLFFLPRIQNVADPLGYEVVQTATGVRFWEEHELGTTALILVDLEGERDTWTAVVEELRRRGEAKSRVIAFGPHADAAILRLARDLGCDAVLTKGKFSSGLGQIIGSRGLEATP
jgi:CheY-like chemotaxis protein